MSTEVAVLALAALLGCLQLMLLSLVANMTMSTRWLVGSRDEPRDFPIMVGRLKRAWENHLEGLILFTAAVAVVEFAGRGGTLTATAAQVYLIARVLYVPVYAFGIPWLRSAIWGAGFFATLLMLIAALLG